MYWIDPTNKTNKIRFKLIERERETDPALLSCIPPTMAWRICFDWDKDEGDEWGRGKKVLILLIEIKILRENLWRDEFSEEKN